MIGSQRWWQHCQNNELKCLDLQQNHPRENHSFIHLQTNWLWQILWYFSPFLLFCVYLFHVWWFHEPFDNSFGLLIRVPFWALRFFDIWYPSYHTDVNFQWIVLITTCKLLQIFVTIKTQIETIYRYILQITHGVNVTVLIKTPFCYFTSKQK